jgi:hypothetical protein
MPEVDLVTFRWGRVSAGRFNPEGRVVFSAAWSGRPLEVFVRPPGSNEAQPLGVGDAALLGVSHTGEIAVLLHPRLVEGVERGTLAIAPAAGGAARELAENVEYAPTDGSPPLKLGSGHALALSRDGAWVLGALRGRRVSFGLGGGTPALEAAQRTPEASIRYPGLMFWLTRNRFVGSYVRFNSARRA